jgi:hypothetical protein
MRVTEGVLPVLEHQGWRVETVELDLGAGLREWIEIRHGDDGPRYVATVAGRDAVHGVDPRDLTETVVIDDGCE